LSSWLKPLLAFMIAGGCAIGSLTRWESLHERSDSGMLSMPPSSVVKAGASGFQNLLADLFYMRFVTYWGYQLTHGRNFHNLAPLLHLIVDLDPRFHSVYEIGAMALGDGGQPDEAVKLLEKGWSRDPRNWQYPYQAGLTLFLFGNDPLRAARYFEQAAELPQAPPEAGFFAARMYERTQRTELARNSWWTIYRRSDDPNVRQIARRALIKLGERLPEAEDHSRIDE